MDLIAILLGVILGTLVASAGTMRRLSRQRSKSASRERAARLRSERYLLERNVALLELYGLHARRTAMEPYHAWMTQWLSDVSGTLTVPHPQRSHGVNDFGRDGLDAHGKVTRNEAWRDRFRTRAQRNARNVERIKRNSEYGKVS